MGHHQEISSIADRRPDIEHGRPLVRCLGEELRKNQRPRAKGNDGGQGLQRMERVQQHVTDEHQVKIPSPDLFGSQVVDARIAAVDFDMQALPAEAERAVEQQVVVLGGAFGGGLLRAGPFAAGIEHVLDLVDGLLDGLAGKPVQRFERRQFHRSDPSAPLGELEREEPGRRADVENAQAAHLLGKREAIEAAAKIVEPGRHQLVAEIDGVVPVVARGFIEPKRPQTFVEPARFAGMLGRDASLLFRLKLLSELLAGDQELMKSAVREALEEVLEAEMEQALGAAKSERSSERLGYRSGYYTRGLVTRIGKIELRVPQDRQGRFRTEVFERYQRSEKALVSALAEMYIEGVSTRKVRKITEQLCGHSFSASAVSGVVKKLDRQLEAFAQRRLEEPYRYLILDARYEKVREGGVIRSQAVLVAVGRGRRRQAGDTGGGVGEPRERLELAGVSRGAAAARSRGGGAGGERRSRRPAAGDRAGTGGGRLATLLRALSAQRVGSSAAQGR